MIKDQQNFIETRDAFGISKPLVMTLAPMGNQRLTPNKANQPLIPENIVSGNLNAQITLVAGFLQSLRFITGSVGWILNSDGTTEFNGNGLVVDTNFKARFTLGTITFFESDGTDPNGNLSGTIGDVCFNCSPAGQLSYNSGGTTNWTLI